MKNTNSPAVAVLLIIICCIYSACVPSFVKNEDSSSDKEVEDIINSALNKHFEDIWKRKVAIKSLFLRKGKTVSGTSFPKFYVWVEIYENNRILEDGAARIGITDEQEVYITDYLNRAEIKNTPQQIFEIFPRDVANKVITISEK